MSIASRIVVSEGPVAAELPSGSALSRCLEPHCPTVLLLDATEWQADRALGTTEWHGRATQVQRPCPARLSRGRLRQDRDETPELAGGGMRTACRPSSAALA